MRATRCSRYTPCRKRLSDKAPRHRWRSVIGSRRRRSTMGPTRYAICICIGLAAWLSPGLRHADGAEVLSVTIEVDASEVITTDLEGVGVAAPAQVRFTVVNDSIASIFGNELTTPLTRMRLEVLYN